MRRGRLLAALLIMAGGHAWAAPADAAQMNTAGWWWRAQTGAAGVPPPPHVPANGLAVGTAPDGPTAVTAVRFALEDDEIDPVLTLTTAEQFAAGQVELVACLSGGPWFGVQAGNWEERPEAACDRAAVNGVTSPDGTAWTFALSPLYADGLLDVVILAAEGSDPFEVSFEAPTDTSLRTTRAPSAVDFGSDFGSTGGETEDYFVPPSGSFTGGGVDFGQPLAPPPPLSEAGPEAPADQPSSGPREFVPIARGRGPAADATTDPRPLAVVVLLAALVLAAALGREPLPAPRLLGPMAGRREPEAAEPEVRGLGRFRQPRRGAAPSLH